jgi:uncharacterized protein (TIGR03066 family)
MANKIMDRPTPPPHDVFPKAPRDLPHGLIAAPERVLQIVAAEKAKFSSDIFTAERRTISARSFHIMESSISIPLCKESPMKTVWTATATCLALALIGSVDAQDKKGDVGTKLVGVWELVKGEGSPGSTVEFKSDGKLIMTAKMDEKVLKLEGTYKVDGKRVTATYKVGGKEVNDPMTIETLSATQLITIDDKGKKDEFKKVKSK